MRKMFSDSILDLGKCPNPKTHESESACFQVGHFARSKIKSKSIFLIKYYIITILKKFGAIRCIFNKVKNGFPIVFSNLALKGSGFFFKLESKFYCQMACIYLLNSHGGPQSLDFVITT